MSFDESKLGSLDIKDDDDEAHIKAADVNNTVTRCGEHCDYGTFTLLVQDSEGGLEVKLPGSDKWNRVGHLPGAGEKKAEVLEKKFSAFSLFSFHQCWRTAVDLDNWKIFSFGEFSIVSGFLYGIQ